MPTVWSDCHLSPILLILRRYPWETKVNGRDGRLAVRLKSRNRLGCGAATTIIEQTIFGDQMTVSLYMYSAHPSPCRHMHMQIIPYVNVVVVSIQ